MENEIRQYIDYLNHNPIRVRIITNDIIKLLVNHEYIDFFMQISMRWSSDNIIECLPHYEKMALLLFKVYIEVEKKTQCYVCDNCKMSIFVPSSIVKEGFWYFTDVKDPYWFAKVEKEESISYSFSQK